MTDNNKVLTDTWMVFEAIINAGRLNSADNFDEKWRIMDDLTSSYFSINCNIEDLMPEHSFFKNAFEKQAMAHALCVQAHKVNSFQISDFDMSSVFEMFELYLSEEAAAG